MATYPVSEEFAKHADQFSIISEFLTWLRDEKQVILSTYQNHEYNPVFRPLDHLLAEFFSIDLKVLDQERRAMLVEMAQLARKA